MSFRAALRRRLKASTVNVVLAQLRMMLRFAKRVRVVAMMPDIERLSVPRNRPKPVYSDDQIELLVGAASSLSSEAHLICLLAVDMGLRVSEICALEWSDIDLDAGSITVQHNAYRGQTQTPKGVIGTLAMTSRLKKALSGSRGHEAHGPLVLYRRSQHTGMEWAPHTP
ncbi:MAG: tyrosine-type recombinase/integrase, partial [Myxococcales bacterium]|nr:tyrosine-type recombinase/integrase [Myxococcales bacterium]